ncbi:hypothetical protein [Nocardia sp. NRRL S-836]|uniref:hypothetical protein n=1 Tax=Nocardia sp. NRRL S-836 TaxID=1519492 RepID=UPI0006ADC8A7|nr:hypothetical protein [Nocardia sp. NRRL S-836]KOV75518.1 hypothetical protein ADL03_44620 [Nocardia sp. NRRL S-836]
MSEQEIREGMLLAVWDEPPLDFDPDALMKRAEQKKSRRRALASVGVATALIVVSAFALPGLLPKTGDGDQIAASRTDSSSPAAAESPTNRTVRIGDALAAKLQTRVQGLRDVSAYVMPGSSFQVITPPSSTTAAKPARVEDGSLSGYVYLTDDVGPTSLLVRAATGLQNERNLCSTAIMCSEVAQADGSKVVQAQFHDGASTVVRAVATRVFESGYMVQISAFTTNPATGSGLRAALPVSVDVLTTLVTDPAIRWE